MNKCEKDEEYEAYNEYGRQLNAEFEKIAKERNCSIQCATNIWYLRTRARHTPALEAELIRLEAEGIHPNMCEFGCTEETQL